MPDKPSAVAKGVHVCRANSRSGIADYALDFHHLVLEPEGYSLVDPDIILRGDEAFAPETRFHVQLGVYQHRERLAATHLLRQGYRNVEATIHDPPFPTFPYFQFESRLLMRLSRGFDWYLGSFGIQRRMLERLNRLFVLSEQGGAALRRFAPKAEVIVIPPIVRKERVWPAGLPVEPALLYFGFIGPSKGVGYALELHRRLNQLRPGTHFHVLGQPTVATDQPYLDRLREQYRENVTFHGYVPDDQLDALFGHAAHVVLPYADHKYIMPSSGSAIQALRRARILWTTDANVMSDMVEDGRNGFFLSMNVDEDAQRMAAVMADETRSRAVSEGARQSALAMAEYPYRRHFGAEPR